MYLFVNLRTFHVQEVVLRNLTKVFFPDKNLQILEAKMFLLRHETVQRLIIEDSKLSMLRFPELQLP